MSLLKQLHDFVYVRVRLQIKFQQSLTLSSKHPQSPPSHIKCLFMEILPYREYVEFQTFISSYAISVRVKRQFYLPSSYVRAYLRVPVYFILTFNASNTSKRYRYIVIGKRYYIFNSFSKIERHI